MTDDALRIDPQRLFARLDALAQVGAIDGGGCCRLALTDDDRRGRDLVVRWMRELDLAVSIDADGNVFGLRAGRTQAAPVMTGSHIGTVRTGGRYDGNLGVLAGLEVLQTLDDARTSPSGRWWWRSSPTRRARFPRTCWDRWSMWATCRWPRRWTQVITYARLGDELTRTLCGWRSRACIGRTPSSISHRAGPVLDAEGVTIGAVQDLQGISGSNSRSRDNPTTPAPRRCAQTRCWLGAMAAAGYVRELAREMGGSQVGTVVRSTCTPNLINVIARAPRSRWSFAISTRAAVRGRRNGLRVPRAACQRRRGDDRDALARPLRAGALRCRRAEQWIEAVASSLA
ncbi:MAG: hypothetical protein R3E48_05180 [Burkholderiaceae bacterium]